MKTTGIGGRVGWLICGIVFGLAVSYFWPHEPAFAVGSDRNDNFVIATCPTDDLNGASEAVFILDFLTGRLSGAVLDQQTGQRFTRAYMRNVAADFQVDPNAKTTYALATGRARIPARGRSQWGASALYIAEMTSGKCGAYAFPYTLRAAKGEILPLQPLDMFTFRGAAAN